MAIKVCSSRKLTVSIVNPVKLCLPVHSLLIVSPLLKQVAESFRAQPLSVSPDLLPPKRTRGATQPEPFEFEVDMRGANKADQWRKQVSNVTADVYIAV